MTTFLFLQKFDGGVPVNLPYGPLMARLSQVGQVGRGRGDLEVALPVDTMAATCTVIGSVNDGVACIGFERPPFRRCAARTGVGLHGAIWLRSVRRHARHRLHNAAGQG
ncbi:hypothetical protein [Massilia sp. TSP1-1-2]|uniref:hypothetical protein n=1 Tax=Massilia sp. TSP1-1-2 TaxID=2804649 RepID=UPI003CE806C6